MNKKRPYTCLNQRIASGVPAGLLALFLGVWLFPAYGFPAGPFSGEDAPHLSLPAANLPNHPNPERTDPGQTPVPSDENDDAEERILEKVITLPRQLTTTYAALNQISRQTGYYFVYDSELIDNDRRIRIQKGSHPLRVFLTEILNDTTLQFRVLEQHILIYQQEAPELTTETVPDTSTVEEARLPEFFTIQGRVLEYDTGNPLPYASISIPGKGTGIASNLEGTFALKLPYSQIDTVVRFSYMGYKPKEMPLRLLRGRNIDVFLETDYISMQEVIIRYYDPGAIIREALSKRKENFSNKPVYLTSFYREGIQRNKKLMRYSEAVFRVYKPAYTSLTDNDQVKLLQSRHITNIEATDSLELKLEAGIGSSLELDFMRNIPDFLDPESAGMYRFTKADIVSYNSRSTYAIEFKQSENINQALYMGILYVDMETLAFVGAEFEVNPKYVNNEQYLFIKRRSRDYAANIEQVKYTVRYQLIDGKYHLEHVRGEVKLRFRLKGKWFSNSYLAFFEHAVFHIETEGVSRFDKDETMKTHTVFAEQNTEYDYSFWGDYNYISPESEISDALSEIRSKIESIVAE